MEIPTARLACAKHNGLKLVRSRFAPELATSEILR
jgi:hypothetical protein